MFSLSPRTTRIVFVLPFVLMAILFLLRVPWRNVADHVPWPRQQVRIAGWLSDERCAGTRMSMATHDAASSCAKHCVDRGQKVVLIASAPKRILRIANQAAVHPYVGTSVEIVGRLNGLSQSIEVEAVQPIGDRAKPTGAPKTF